MKKNNNNDFDDEYIDYLLDNEIDDENGTLNNFLSKQEHANKNDVLREMEEIKSNKQLGYELLFKISKTINQKDGEKIKRWNKFNVSSFDDYNQIFYDIANSRKAKKIYLWTNLFLIFNYLMKIFVISLFIFLSCALIISKYHFFILGLKEWKIISISLIIFVILFVLLKALNNKMQNSFLKHFEPHDETGKINTSVSFNKTPDYFNAGSWFVIKVKTKTRSKYKIYTANNGKKYLVEINRSGRYYSLRNWYLIAKYITLGKMKINDLNEHFEDELFVYLTNENFVKEKLKLRIFFNIDFSLNFFCNQDIWLNLFLPICFLCNLIITSIIW